MIDSTLVWAIIQNGFIIPIAFWTGYHITKDAHEWIGDPQ